VRDVMEEIRKRVERDERVLVTTLTKKFAEELSEFLLEEGLKVRYLHSDIKVLERVEIIRELRSGKIDALIGINLLREGLDLPEVTLVAVLDADKEGYLRSKTSLIQTCGRASRNVDGTVILYADKRTDSIDGAIAEMERRRQKQQEHNEAHGITPTTIIKPVRALLEAEPDDADAGAEVESGRGRGRGKKGKGKARMKQRQAGDDAAGAAPRRQFANHQDLLRHVKQLRGEMMAAAKNLDFELAAQIRDEVYRLEQADMELL
jgi:excinuclease ABC subunit B